MVFYLGQWTSSRALKFSLILLPMHVLICLRHIFWKKFSMLFIPSQNLVSIRKNYCYINQAYWFVSKTVLNNEVSLPMAMVRSCVGFLFLLKFSSAWYHNCSGYWALAYHLSTRYFTTSFSYVHEASVEQFCFSMLIVLHFVISVFFITLYRCHHNDESNTAEGYCLNSYWQRTNSIVVCAPCHWVLWPLSSPRCSPNCGLQNKCQEQKVSTACFLDLLVVPVLNDFIHDWLFSDEIRWWIFILEYVVKVLG